MNATERARPPSRTDITLVIAGMGPGGAERVLTNMAVSWAKDVHRAVTVLTLAAPESDFFRLPDTISRVGLGMAATPRPRLGRLAGNVIALIRLRRALQGLQPDVVISFVDVMNVKVLLASLAKPWPVVVAERIDPGAHTLRRPWVWLRRLVYRQAAMIVVQTGDAAEWVRRRFPRSVVGVIPNPVLTAPIAAERDSERGPLLSRPAIVAVGRLVPQKGFDLLIRAFASACTKLPREGGRWHLFLFGEGPERTKLETLAQRLRVDGRVHLPGTTRDTAAVFREADLFVLASRYEGFPNALLEAMANGVASVSTACRSGPADIVRDGIDGLLVPPDDPDAMAGAMARLMTDGSERRRLAARAPEVLRRYNVEDVMVLWDRAIESAISRRSERTRSRVI